MSPHPLFRLLHPGSKRAFAASSMIAICLIAFCVSAGSARAANGQVERNRLFFAGDENSTRFAASLRLDDGDLLVAGSTSDLAWTGDAPRVLWTVPAGPASARAAGGERYAIILRLSPQLDRIRAVYHFPKGAIEEISRLRSTNVPGRPLGAVYLSGRFPGLTGLEDGYWIGRLEGGFGAAPTARPAGEAETAALAPASPRVAWLHFVSAPGFRSSTKGQPADGEGDYARRQPWDVRSDGRVIYAEGAPYWDKWSGLRVLEPDGKLGALPGWLTENGMNFLALKPGRAGSLRSTTQQDFDHRQPDENDNPGRKGRYPDDYYFTGPTDTRGRGYTGYRAVGTTQRVSPLVIDRRDNSLYFGTSTQTRLPNGLPDFEPAFVRLDADGRLVWWARGYREVERVGENKEANQDAINSPPDQYVDQVAIDYAQDRVLFVARAHGGGVINFWTGSKLVRAGGRAGFLDHLHDSGNVHVSWLGAYALADGKIHRSTWIAELTDNASNLGKPHQEGPLAGWPRPNQGWTRQNTTRVDALVVDDLGRPAVLAVGRRPYTTRYALIENVKPSEGRSAWAPFARLYNRDLTTLDYSTILRGPWDPATGEGGADLIVARDLHPVPGGLLVVGEHRAAPADRAARPPAAVNPPRAWGSATPPGRAASGFVALLRIDNEEEEKDGPAPAGLGTRSRTAY